MTSAEPVGGPGTPEPDPSRRRVPPASGIYGLVVAGSVLAAVGSDLPTGALALAVFVTWWCIGSRRSMRGWLSTPAPVICLAGLGLGRRSKRSGRSWAASYIPVVTLLLARLLGATPSTAALIALIVIVALLMVYGWRAGRAAGLRGFPLAVMTLLAGGLGLLMIVLKFVLGNLH